MLSWTRAWWLLRALTGLAIPLAVYYALRAGGVSIYLALLASTLVSAVPSAVTLLRERRLDAMSAYLTAMLLGSVVVSLASGSTRFLLAKGAVLTGVTGVWFLASTRWGGRPLTFTFTRPLTEGRLRWPPDWDSLWESSARFRRMWRVSSVLYGIGLLADAVLRVVMAWTLPPDAVPALATALYAATTAVLIVVTNVYYVVCRVHDPRSAMYHERPVVQDVHGGRLSRT